LPRNWITIKTAETEYLCEVTVLEVTKLNETPSAKNPHNVDARPIYTHEHAQVVVLTLQAGESLRRHVTPVDVFFYVLEGTGTVEIGDEKQQVTKDSIVHSPAKIVHCWYNISDKPLRILVAKTPKPTESTILL
jgi:quercetin dioxygenase-like cupin family protein